MGKGYVGNKKVLKEKLASYLLGLLVFATLDKMFGKGCSNEWTWELGTSNETFLTERPSYKPAGCKNQQNKQYASNTV